MGGASVEAGEDAERAAAKRENDEWLERERLSQEAERRFEGDGMVAKALEPAARRMRRIAALAPELAVPAFEVGAGRLNWAQLVDFAHKSSTEFALIDFLCEEACERGPGERLGLGMWAPRARSREAVALIGVAAGLALRALGARWCRLSCGDLASHGRLPFAASMKLEKMGREEVARRIAALAPVISDWMAGWETVESARALSREELDRNGSGEGSLLGIGDGQMPLLGFMRQIGLYGKPAGWGEGAAGRSEVDPVREAIARALEKAPLSAARAMELMPRHGFSIGSRELAFVAGEIEAVGGLARREVFRRLESRVSRALQANVWARRELACALLER